MSNGNRRSFEKRLQDALGDAFDLSTLRMMVRQELGIRLDRIVPTWPAFNEVVFNLIEWAVQQGQLLELVTAAAAWYADNGGRKPDLANLAREL